MAVKFTNNAVTTLTAGISAGVTQFAVASNSGFPSLGGADHTYVTINSEVVKVTARSSNTLTIVRAQDNTSARAFSSGDTVELRLNAALLADISGNTTTVANNSTDETVYPTFVGSATGT